ncbi:AbrB/MazE/SpoVT family DNA-binding domain-containing protein [Shimazuella sp. AN120528]|uniref:AbrB/MazE/SpoVT family DNA-binding domain-containing protein n=1 Tax=Shimazuella soli TaxID=1892854 RepID=UPI001F11764B|nr:AbrB/MazE/SpoVT family DNA-binding domain-containing protein [Shimazuella soli]MCH5585990.1 AbrB/MazE/SpoVT family DNA-binding domain-containing protein [Shimazuella soli]
MERKRIKVSSKRQITIPQSFFNKLQIKTEVDCILKDGELVIRPVDEDHFFDFSDLILEDLLKQGIPTEDLVEEFRKNRKNVKHAFEQIIDEGKHIAKKHRENNIDETTELFGDLMEESSGRGKI